MAHPTERRDDEARGRGGAFWLYAGIAVLAFLFFFTQVPETKDQSLEEIERDLGADSDETGTASGRPRTEPQTT